MRKILLSFLMLGIVVLGGFSVAESGDSLTFVIAADKKEYFKGDIVSLNLNIKNIGNEGAQVLDFSQIKDFVFSPQVSSFDVRASGGAKIEVRGSVLDYWPGDRIKVLPPGQEMSIDVVLNNERAQNYFVFTAPNDYKITVNLNLPSGTKIVSNSIAFSYGKAASAAPAAATTTLQSSSPSTSTLTTTTTSPATTPKTQTSAPAK